MLHASDDGRPLYESLGFEIVGKAEHRRRRLDGPEQDVLILAIMPPQPVSH